MAWPWTAKSVVPPQHPQPPDRDAQIQATLELLLQQQQQILDTLQAQGIALAPLRPPATPKLGRWNRKRTDADVTVMTREARISHQLEESARERVIAQSPQPSVPLAGSKPAPPTNPDAAPQ